MRWSHRQRRCGSVAMMLSLSWLPAPRAQTVPDAEGGCPCAVGVVMNTDYNGHDVKNPGGPGFDAFVSDSPLKCCELCAAHDECVWWQQTPTGIGKFSNR